MMYRYNVCEASFPGKCISHNATHQPGRFSASARWGGGVRSWVSGCQQRSALQSGHHRSRCSIDVFVHCLDGHIESDAVQPEPLSGHDWALLTQPWYTRWLVASMSVIEIVIILTLFTLFLAEPDWTIWRTNWFVNKVFVLSAFALILATVVVRPELFRTRSS